MLKILKIDIYYFNLNITKKLKNKKRGGLFFIVQTIFVVIVRAAMETFPTNFATAYY